LLLQAAASAISGSTTSAKSASTAAHIIIGNDVGPTLRAPPLFASALISTAAPRIFCKRQISEQQVHVRQYVSEFGAFRREHGFFSHAGGNAAQSWGGVDRW